MQFNSLIPGEMLTALDSPQADPDSSRLSIPPAISMVIAPGGVSRPDTPGIARTESHFANDARTVANAAASSGTMTTLKKGIWRITGSYFYVSSVVAAPAISTIRVSQGGSVIGNLATFFPHTTVTISGIVRIDTQLTLDKDTDIIHLVNATGVGERSTATATLHFLRMA